MRREGENREKWLVVEIRVRGRIGSRVGCGNKSGGGGGGVNRE